MVHIWLLAVGLAAAIPDPGNLAKRLTDAARLEQSGDTAAALTAYRSLLLLAGTDDSARARILESLAALEATTGDYPSATQHATEAAAIHAARGDARRRASALNSVGLSSLYAGQYDVATRALNDAVALSTSVGDDSGRAEQVTNLGNVFFFTGRYAEAARAYDAALRGTAAHRDEPWAARRRRIVKVNQATLSQRLGRDQHALELYREIDAEGTDLRPREQAQILMNLGVLYRRLGDPVKALTAYEQALELFSRDHHVDGELGVINNRGIALALDLGDFEAAERSFSEALTRAMKAGNRREVLHAELYRGEAALRAGLLEAARRDFEASLEAARELRTPEEAWKALYGLGRVDLRSGRRTSAARHLEDAVGVIEGIREAIRVPTFRSDFFTDKREVYDALISVELDGATPERVFHLIERSHSRAWRERLGLPGSVDLDAVRRALPRGAVLFDFWNSSLGSALVTVARDRVDVRRVDVDEAAVRRLVDAVGRGPSSDWNTAAAAITSSLLPPDLPPGTQHLFVVPDGALALVPFDLLSVAGQPLVDQVAVSYLPTAAMVLRSEPARPLVIPPWTLRLRAFGDPVFQSSDLDDAGAVRKHLSSSIDEMHGIASELSGRSTLHTGRDDLKAYLYDRTGVAPILHMATHAIADTNALEQSRILFSPAPDGGGADYLFLKEAYDLRLQAVELAVLSACETERGRVLRGEGVQSFSRAFLAAGARSSVTTLWSVPDRPTAAFMKIFYHFLQRGLPRAEALRLAKLRFLHSGSDLSDPHYWAAFVLTGDGTRPIPRAMSWTTIGLAGAAMLLVGIGGWRRVRRRGSTRYR